MAQESPSIRLEGFLRELGMAWQRLSLYQEGHPARRKVVTRAHAVLAALAAARGDLAVGVARDGFVARDRKVGGGPVRGLAESLYRRHVALVRFHEETGVEDLKAFLESVPRGRPAADEPPLWDRLAARGVTAVRLEAVDLGYVRSDEEGGAPKSVGAEPLWDGLLRAVLDELDRDGETVGRDEPTPDRSLRGVLDLVERLLDRRGLSFDDLRGRPSDRSAGPGAGAGAGIGAAAGPGPDSGTAPARGAPGEAVSAVAGALGAALASRLAAGGRGTGGPEVGELLQALPEALAEAMLDRALAELVAPSGTRAEASAEAFSTLAESLPALRTVAALRRLRAEGVSFSPSVVSLIDGLIARAGRRDPAASAGGEGIDDDPAALFGDDDPDRRLPREDAIDRIALELAHPEGVRPGDEGAVSLRVETLTEESRLGQLAHTLLDLLERPFLKRPAQEAAVRRLGEVFRALLADGRLDRALAIPERVLELRAAGASASELAFEELCRPESVTAFLERSDELSESAAAVARRLTELLGDAVLDGLLEALCEEEDLSRRRQLFDLAAALGPPVVPRARAFLDDERWYVQRNMISLLRRIGGGLSEEVLRHGLDRQDPRVRLEAVKALGRGPVPPEVVARAVSDPDPKVAQAAISAVGKHRLKAAVAPLLDLIEPRDPFGRKRSLRLLALEALGRIGDPSALDRLAPLLRPWFSPVSTEERRAAYASLAGYPPEARRRWLDRGRWSSDPVVRRTCREIRRAAGHDTEAGS